MSHDRGGRPRRKPTAPPAGRGQGVAEGVQSVAEGVQSPPQAWSRPVTTALRGSVRQRCA